MPQFAPPLPNDSKRKKIVLIALAVLAVVAVIALAFVVRSIVIPEPKMPATNAPEKTERTAPAPEEIQRQLDALVPADGEKQESPTPKEIEKQLDDLGTTVKDPSPAPTPEEIQRQLDALSNTK
jgi:flagellar basal body-associated protein FliL